MRVLVTGGAGFIGSHLIDRLLKDGHTVVCFDNFDNYYPPYLKWRNIHQNFNNTNFSIMSGTVTDMRSLSQVFNDNIDAVIHLAAQAGVRPSIQNPQLHYEVNVLGTVNILELCKKHNIKKLIYVSSSSVYGNNPEAPSKETYKADMPLCPYAASKKAGENICYTYAHLYNMNISCMRPFTVYGSRQRTEMAIPLFTRLIYNKQPIVIFGDGSTERDYTHVSDVVDGLIASLERVNGYEVYNLGTQQTISIIKLIRIIWLAVNECLITREKQTVPFPVIEYRTLSSGEAKFTYADISKSREKLNYEPKMTLALGLHEYVDWYLSEEVKVHAI